MRYSIHTSKPNRRKVILLLLFIGVGKLLFAQTQSISGNTCVRLGVQNMYTFIPPGYSPVATYFTWQVTGGSIVVGGSGLNQPVVQVVWNSPNGSISVTTSNPSTSSSLNVTSNPVLQPGAITAGKAQAINFNTIPAAISCSGATGGSCMASYSYQWQKSTDGVNFTDTSGATGLNLSFSSALTQSMYYRNKVTESASGGIKYTDIAAITVYPKLQAGTLNPLTQRIGYNKIASPLTVAGTTGGDGTYTYLWRTSADGNNWTDMPGPSTSFTPAGLTSTTWYRVIVTSNGVKDSTGSATVNVNPLLNPGTLIPAGINIPGGTSPGVLTGSSASGGFCGGSYLYQWQVSTDGSNFSDIIGASDGIYTPGNLTANTWFRRRVICWDTVYTNTCLVTIGAAAENLNFIRVRDISRAGVTDETTANGLTDPLDVKQNTRYFDGLGRLIQTVNRQSSPQGQDQVNLTVYDGFGREAIRYLTYASPSGDGNYKPFGLQEQAGFNAAQFPGENYYYGQVLYEASPLNRVLATYAPGNSWAGGNRGVSNGYQVNGPDDSVQVWNILSPQGSLPFSAGTYPAGQLFRNITTDEQNHQVAEYKDKEGRVILKKVQLAASPGMAHAGWLCTYYVYDDLDNLRLVIQPRAVDWLLVNGWSFAAAGGPQVAGELCFRYEYDSRNRMIIRKVPGAGEVWMVYDVWNRLVFSQDSNQRTNNNQWLCTLYDGLNRVTTTGLINYNGTQAQLQQLVTAQTGSGGDGIITITGSSPSALQANLSLNGSQLSGYYQATQSVSLAGESSTADAGGFTGETVPETFQNSSNPVAVNSNPLPPGVSLQPLTVNFYDDYNWIAGSGTALTSGMDNGNTSNGSYFITAYNTSPTYALQPVQFGNTKGLQTGNMSLVLGAGNQYLTTVTFYDDHGRIIQTQSINLTGGKDITTHQYDFSGRMLRTLQQHQKSGSNPQSHVALSKMAYDPAGRLLSQTKTLTTTINGQIFTSPEQMIASNQYNELGQLRAKYLGGIGVSALDSLVYAYNIRGWLTSINKGYLSSGSFSPSNYFGMELGYDKTASVTGTANYSTPAFNGNISGTIWKSAGDGINRKYDFTYDNTNRLTGADFNQAAGSGFDKSAGIDFSVSNLQYDANGNILSMNQRGFKPGGSVAIDQLAYYYNSNSNKLGGVYDSANDAGSKLGDFHYPGTKPSGADTTDYAYDGNGNLNLDGNKSIDQISYNYLNQPQLVHMKGKGTIQYVYDASGNKLKKVIMDSTSGQSMTTLYINGFVYQQTGSVNNAGGGVDTLQFTVHDEGRARWTFHKYTNGMTAYGWEYDFFEKDHLGNTRVLLTQQRDTAGYLASMEGAYRNTENALFYNIPNTCVSRAAAGYPADTTVTNPNDSVSRLNGNGPKVGPAIILKVMSGDKAAIGVNYYYASSAASPGNPLSSNDLINSLASGIVSLSGGGAHGSLADLTGSASPLPAALTSFISKNDSIKSGKPNAYLNWILFDNQFNFVSASSGARQVAAAGAQSGGGLQPPLVAPVITMAKSGYLYIYVSNSTPGWDVYFDNLSVRTYGGPMLEETHYYPYGLTMAGISDKALKANYAENKFRFNRGAELQNKEFSDGSGLETYETHLRELDPQVGRWWQIDPRPPYEESPYASMKNNPVLHNDPLGDTARYYDNTGKMLYQRPDGSTSITPAIIGPRNLKAFNAAVAGGKSTIGDLNKLGTVYDAKSFSDFYAKNHNIKATSIDGIPVNKISDLKIDGKSAGTGMLHSEVVGNLVLKDGKVTMGNNPPVALGDVTGGDPDRSGDEPGKVAGIHTHPTARTQKIDFDVKTGTFISGHVFTLYGGTPSPPDYNNAGRSDTEYRQVLVDSRYIYLYNSNAGQTIKIPRQ